MGRGTWYQEVREMIRDRGHQGKTGPNGRPLCNWCGTEVPKRCRVWCASEECHNMVDALYGGPRWYIRKFLGPECAECGLDVVALERRVGKIWGHHRKAVRLVLEKAGFNGSSSLWEADHVLPIAEGGRDRPDNLQRLCVPCHKRKTAEQAARKARKGKKQMEIDLLRADP